MIARYFGFVDDHGLRGCAEWHGFDCSLGGRVAAEGGRGDIRAARGRKRYWSDWTMQAHTLHTALGSRGLNVLRLAALLTCPARWTCVEHKRLGGKGKSSSRRESSLLYKSRGQTSSPSRQSTHLPSFIISRYIVTAASRRSLSVLSSPVQSSPVQQFIPRDSIPPSFAYTRLLPKHHLASG